MKKLLILSCSVFLAGAGMAQAAEATRSNGAPSGRSQPSPSTEQPSSIGDSKDGGVASNNAYGKSNGTTGATYHGKRGGPIPRPSKAPLPGKVPDK